MLIKLLKNVKWWLTVNPSQPPSLLLFACGWRNVYWLELKKKLVVSIIVCKHRLLKASSELSSPATHMLYIQFILETRLEEHSVYNSRVTQLMGGRVCLGVSRPSLFTAKWRSRLMSSKPKHQERSQGQLPFRESPTGACNGPLLPHQQKCFAF